jgi:MFS family permease
VADGEDTASPFREPVVQVIVAATLMGVMGVSLISPALPEVRRGLGVTEAQASLILSAFTLPGIVLGPVSGVLADWWGRKVVLVPSLFVYGLAGSAILVADSFRAVLALRVLQGGAAAALVTLAITLVGDAFEGARRNAIMGLNGAMLSVGTGAYPLLGGLLSEVDWRAPFAVYLVGVPVGFFALRVLDEPTREAPQREGSYLGGALDALPAGRSLLLYGTALIVFVLLYGGVLTTVPFLLERDLGLSAVAIGVILGLPSAATAAASSQNGRLARRFSNDVIIVAGVASLGVGLALMSRASTPVRFAAAILPFGAGMGLVMPSLDTAISVLVPTDFRAGAMSVRTSMVRLGQTVGPPLFTGLFAVVTERFLLLAAGGVGLATAVLVALVGPRTRPDEAG